MLPLAEHVSGTEEAFADLMNQYAAELGMEDTHFMNSSGWPHEDHYTTARDLATLARALIRDHPDIYAMHSIREFTYNDIKQPNRNRLLWKDTSVDGIKTGPYRKRRVLPGSFIGSGRDTLDLGSYGSGRNTRQDQRYTGVIELFLPFL